MASLIRLTPLCVELLNIFRRNIHFRTKSEVNGIPEGNLSRVSADPVLSFSANMLSPKTLTPPGLDRRTHRTLIPAGCISQAVDILFIF